MRGGKTELEASSHLYDIVEYCFRLQIIISGQASERLAIESLHIAAETCNVESL
jgi:hypothetical protein